MLFYERSKSFYKKDKIKYNFLYKLDHFHFSSKKKLPQTPINLLKSHTIIFRAHWPHLLLTVYIVFFEHQSISRCMRVCVATKSENTDKYSSTPEIWTNCLYVCMSGWLVELRPSEESILLWISCHRTMTQTQRELCEKWAVNYSERGCVYDWVKEGGIRSGICLKKLWIFVRGGICLRWFLA